MQVKMETTNQKTIEGVNFSAINGVMVRQEQKW